MTGPAPSLTTRRWQADFRSNLAFAAGEAAPAPRSLLVCVRNAIATAYSRDRTATTFGIDVPRATDRGAIIEAAGRQLYRNSLLVGPPDGLPQNWRLATGGTPSDIVRSTVNGLPGVTLTVTVNNTTGAPVNYRLDLDRNAAEGPGAGLFVPASRQAVFSGVAMVVSATGAASHESRLIVRDAFNTAASNQGRAPLGVGTLQPFISLPPIPEDGLYLNAAITWIAAPGISTTRLTVAGLQIEEGTSPTSFIPQSPDLVIRTEGYPNPSLTGAAPGTLPPEIALGPAAAGVTNDLQVINVTTDGDGNRTVDLQLTTNAAGSATTQEVFLSRPVGAPAGVIPVNAGEVWEAGLEYAVLSANPDTNIRFNVIGRDDAGAQVGASTTVGLTSTTLVRVTRPPLTISAGATSLVMGVRISVAAGTSRTVQFRVRLPSAVKVTSTPGTGDVPRPGDGLSLGTPGLFSGITEQLIDAELDGLTAGAVLQSIVFASGYKLTLVAGPDTGVIVYPPSGEPVSVTSPLHAAPGVMRLAVAWRPGQVAIGWPDCCERDFATLDIPGFDPTTATAAWLGSDNGSNVLSTAVRTIELSTASTTARDLKLRTRDSWAPAHFVQPRTGFVGSSIALAAAYTPRQLVVEGPATTYTDLGNGYTARSNGGAAMNDLMPAANSVGSVEGRPKRFQMRNIDSTGTLTITCPGFNLYAFQSANPYTLPPVASVVLQPGQRAFFCADGYNPATGLWQAGNENWWFVIREGINLDETYNFLSIYGPQNELDPNRAIIFPPHYCAYNADIGPVRQQAAAMVAAMNRWVRYRSQADAANGMRILRDACASNYWYRSIGQTTITALKSQICSTGFAYLGLRDSGVGSAEDHRIIKAWFADRMEQSIAFFNAQTAAGAGTARGNHGQQAALAAAVCACILDRADFLRYAIAGFELVVNDSADTPGSVGACLLEMKRADKSLSYSCLAMTSITALAEILERCGYPAYAFRGGHLIKMVNFVAAAVDDPSIITNEQARLIGLGGIWGDNVIAVTQQPLPLGNDLDPNTGEQLVAESGVAFLAMAFKRLTLAQAPWKPIWGPRLGAFGTVFNGTIGGAQSYLYFLFGVVVPDFPAEA